MAKKWFLLPCVLILFLSSSQAFLFPADEGVPLTLKAFSETVLMEIGRDPGIVQEVALQNGGYVSLDAVKQADEAWRGNKSLDRFMWEKLSNACAFYLRRYQVEHPFLVEIFVMDNQGANVGQTGKTSDYWQGDEAKFIESYKNGDGALHYGAVEYDESSDEIVVQVSVPVMAGGRAIGAITFGISLDRWERR